MVGQVDIMRTLLVLLLLTGALMGTKGFHPVSIDHDPFKDVEDNWRPKPLPWYYRIDPMLLLAGILVAVLLMAFASRALANEIQVVDGDTVRVGKTTYRLVGYDTPELNSTCWEERVLAQKAKDRLAQLLRDYFHTLTAVRCSCPPGSHGTWFCNYGRSCAILSLEGGLNVADTLIEDGLARPYQCTFTKCPPRKRWC